MVYWCCKLVVFNFFEFLWAVRNSTSLKSTPKLGVASIFDVQLYLVFRKRKYSEMVKRNQNDIHYIEFLKNKKILVSLSIIHNILDDGNIC